MSPKHQIYKDRRSQNVRSQRSVPVLKEVSREHWWTELDGGHGELSGK